MLELRRGPAAEDEEIGGNQSVQGTRKREFADSFELIFFSQHIVLNYLRVDAPLDYIS